MCVNENESGVALWQWKRDRQRKRKSTAGGFCMTLFLQRAAIVLRDSTVIVKETGVCGAVQPNSMPPSLKCHSGTATHIWGDRRIKRDNEDVTYGGRRGIVEGIKCCNLSMKITSTCFTSFLRVRWERFHCSLCGLPSAGAVKDTESRSTPPYHQEGKNKPHKAQEGSQTGRN